MQAYNRQPFCQKFIPRYKSVSLSPLRTRSIKQQGGDVSAYERREEVKPWEKDKYWLQIFGYRSIDEAIDLMEKTQACLRFTKTEEKKAEVLSYWLSTPPVCPVGKEHEWNRHHMLPKCRKGTRKKQNILPMHTERHKAFHQRFGIHTWNEIMKELKKIQKKRLMSIAA